MKAMALWDADFPPEPDCQDADQDIEDLMVWEDVLSKDEELDAFMATSQASESTLKSKHKKTSHPDDRKGWYPYPDKTMFLLDVLTNLPRLHVTDTLLRIFLWILRETGASDVLSLFALRKFQESLRRQCSVPTMQYTSPKSNIFYYNDPRVILSKDWSTPKIRRHMQVYPVIPDGPISEIWHAQKFHQEMDVNSLSPMFDAGMGCHFYVKEIAQLQDGRFVIPMRWLEMEKTSEIVADAYPLEIDS
ncbi:hypothetical protein CERSUDRAFT_99488 [Gelatoporia subvermispora B]|uniref:Uncharacterized protein n=1 Tax=Ceriporiopsis subvermispora (strain B) TaxID=914234 RepID=M2R0M9_CERS8|nr:hypothetical protein CERSUDRAFT_99488 [Gelatoporia subvermispora B]